MGNEFLGVPLSNQNTLDQDLRDVIRQIRRTVAERGLSGSSEFAFVCDELGKLRDPLREPCEYLYFQAHSIGVTTMNANQSGELHERFRETRFFWTALGLLVFVVLISIFIPEPSPWQMQVLRLVMALFAAAFVAYLPGMLTIKGTLPEGSLLNKGSIKASGAFAVLVLVYYYAPTIMRTK